MSAKYKKIKQADEALPAPLRWLTRAFSSITLSVFLLIGVAIYGALGSVPVYFMLVGLAWLVIFGGLVGAVGWGSVKIANRPHWTARRKLLIGGLALLGTIAAASALCWEAYLLIDAMPIFVEHKATVIYRLPAIEMNETEFFGWWPLQILLLLFVINMVWATVRRIEFSLPRLGVLTVHTGIVTMALGSVFYSQLKVEGDMFIVRSDLPGARPVSHFYDRKMPAMFVSVDRAPAVQFELPELPRYNDYAPGELDIKLHEKPGFTDRFGDDLRLTIPGFIAYGELESTWVEAPAAPGNQGIPLPGTGPALTLAMGDQDASGDGPRFTLPAARPADRVLENEGWAVEYLHAPSAQRLNDLMSEAPVGARHALRVEIPAKNYRQVWAITPGDAFDVGDTGYRIAVEEIGPYGLPFVTEGYRGAADTQTTLRITRPGPVKPLQRFALHRYPERTQDFVDGNRGDPAPDIRTTYLDQSKIQVHLFTDPPPPEVFPAIADVPSELVEQAGGLWVLLRIAGIKPVISPLVEGKLPLVDPTRDSAWLHVVDRLEHAVPAQQPVVTPKALRDPKIEGTYEKALVPVLVEADLRDENFELTGETFSQTVTLRQMPYLEQQGGEMRPQTVSVPGYGNVEVSFSRRRLALPFAVAMTDFEMTPYAGSDIPRDFQSDLLVYPVDDSGQPDGAPERYFPRLNNPAVVRAQDAPLRLSKIKLSQAGWDPGDPETSPRDKQLRDEQGRFINQQRFTILGVGNNVGVRVVALGGVLIALGIPWAFYVKPWMIKRRAKKFNASLSKDRNAPEPDAKPIPHVASETKKPEPVLAEDERR